MEKAPLGAERGPPSWQPLRRPQGRSKPGIVRGQDHGASVAGVETRGRVGLGDESPVPPRREGSPRRVLNKMCHDRSRGLVVGTGNDGPYWFLQERVLDHGGGDCILSPVNYFF